MGKAIAMVLSDFLALKHSGKISEGIEASAEALKTKVDLDVDLILTLTGVKLRDYLNFKKMASGPIEKLADYFTEFGKCRLETDRVIGEKALRRALELLSFVNDSTTTYSMERKQKEDEILALLGG